MYEKMQEEKTLNHGSIQNSHKEVETRDKVLLLQKMQSVPHDEQGDFLHEIEACNTCGEEHEPEHCWHGFYEPTPYQDYRDTELRAIREDYGV